jgi:hypothetical protein
MLEYSILPLNEPGPNARLLGNVGLNGSVELAVRPPTVTVTGACDAPAGTMNCSVVAVAELTLALTAPHHTTFSEATALKPVPAISTTAPVLARRGLTEVMMGAWANAGAMQNRKEAARAILRIHHLTAGLRSP